MALKKKVTTYVDEDLLRSVKALAARSDVRIYEVINEALRRYLKEADALEPPLDEPSLAEALYNQRTQRPSTEEQTTNIALEAVRESRQEMVSGNEKQQRLPPPTPEEVEEWERRREERRRHEDR